MTINRRGNQGFTLMELLVAMTLVLLLLFLTNHLFQSTNRAVTTGIQTNKVLATARVINDQLSKDIEEDRWLGPKSSSAAGGYIVIVQRRIKDMPMYDPQTLVEVEVDEIRSDQLIFIRRADGLTSMTPRNNRAFGNTLNGNGTFAKVYYGHVHRTNPDGTLPSSITDTHDKIGSNWMLGRQAMLFHPTGLVTTGPGRDRFAASGYAKDAYQGYTDVTGQAYGPGTGSLLEGLLAGGVSDDRYYYNTSYLTNPLYANPRPSFDEGYSSNAIAQTHSILAHGCSDIVIDFAADLNGNGRVDTTGTNDLGGAIRWYDTLRSPRGDTPKWIPQTRSSSRADVKQPMTKLSSDTNVFVFRADDTEPYDTTAGGTQAHSYWPYMIRIRYRLHDTRGRLTSHDQAALRDGLDNDGDGIPDNPEETRASGRWFERIIHVPRP